MQALEKSKPLERRGSADAADPYEIDESSFGERGTRLLKTAVLELPMSFEGICKLRQRGKLGLLGVTGFGATHASSFDCFVGSTKDGDGKSAGFRSIEDHGRGFVDRLKLCACSLPTIRASWGFCSFCNWRVSWLYADVCCPSERRLSMSVMVLCLSWLPAISNY